MGSLIINGEKYNDSSIICGLHNNNDPVASQLGDTQLSLCHCQSKYPCLSSTFNENFYLPGTKLKKINYLQTYNYLGCKQIPDKGFTDMMKNNKKDCEIYAVCTHYNTTVYEPNVKSNIKYGTPILLDKEQYNFLCEYSEYTQLQNTTITYYRNIQKKITINETLITTIYKPIYEWQRNVYLYVDQPNNINSKILNTNPLIKILPTQSSSLQDDQKYTTTTLTKYINKQVTVCVDNTVIPTTKTNQDEIILPSNININLLKTKNSQLKDQIEVTKNINININNLSNSFTIVTIIFLSISSIGITIVMAFLLYKTLQPKNTLEETVNNINNET